MPYLKKTNMAGNGMLSPEDVMVHPIRIASLNN